MSRARLVLTDSGGIQEETTILGVPCLTLRDNTERPVTVTHGTNRIIGTDPARIVAEALRTLRPGAQFRVERSLELYATRLGGETIPSWQWLLLRPERDPGTPVAALVLTTRPPGQAVLSVVDVLWDEARVSAASVLHAMARTARAEGFKKLSMLTLAESRLARSLERCGFIRREGTLPLVVQRIREDAVLPPVQDWVLTYFDGSAW